MGAQVNSIHVSSKSGSTEEESVGREVLHRVFLLLCSGINWPFVGEVGCLKKKVSGVPPR